MPAVVGAIREISSRLVLDGRIVPTSSVPTDVSEVVIVASVERYQRSVVASDRPAPELRTVADSLNVPPGAGLASDTEGVPTSRSGGAPTTSVTASEQLFEVSDSWLVTSMHAP